MDDTIRLVDLVDNVHTDKNTYHSYLDTYQERFQRKRTTAKHVMEIGIGYQKEVNGGSIKLWHDYFVNAQVYAVDIVSLDNVWHEIHNRERITLFTETDGYQPAFVEKLRAEVPGGFDIILDDGPHTLESMKSFLQLYLPLLADDGILVIEDVQKYEWMSLFYEMVPEELRDYIAVFDLRETKNRWDDLIFMVDLGRKQPN